jgi:signal transduction histidine kinase
MEERATQLGGTVSVSVARPQGTCILVRVPHRSTADFEGAHGT